MSHPTPGTFVLRLARAALSVPFFALAVFAICVVFAIFLPGGRYASSEAPADLTRVVSNPSFRLVLCLPALCYTAFCIADGVRLLRGE